jgi:hypothetical protein
MKKAHQILQIVLLIYFAFFLLFFLGFSSFGGLFGMEEITSDAMITIFLIGIILFLSSWVAGTMRIKNQQDQMSKKELEMNSLKAKLYDFEHPTIAPAKDSPVPPIKLSDSEPSTIPKRQNITD